MIVAQPGPIKNLRYEDNFDYLMSDTVDKRGPDHLKHIALSADSSVRISFGGEIREWYELRSNANWGDLPPGFVADDDGALLSRLMLHADFWSGSRFRIFGQLNSTFEIGSPNEPLPEIAEDALDLHQAFIETRLGPDEQPDRFLLRAGRQEFNFGNEMLVSSREGPNNRLSFDAASAIYRHSELRLQLFAASPVIINTEVFDNERIDEYLWGLYAEWQNDDGLKLDAYYLGFKSDRRVYQHVPGEQVRHTIGARLWNHAAPLYYDIESMYQFGKFNSLTISAYNVTGVVRHYFSGDLRPMLGIGGSFISGDPSESDNNLNTYDPLYPKPTFGLGAPLGPSNITSFRPMVGLALDEALFVNGSVYFLARQSRGEGSFTPGMNLIRPLPPAASDSKYIGTQYALDVFFVPDEHWTFISFLAYIPPGAYVRDTGNGKDIYFLALSAAYKF